MANFRGCGPSSFHALSAARWGAESPPLVQHHTLTGLGTGAGIGAGIGDHGGVRVRGGSIKAGGNPCPAAFASGPVRQLRPGRQAGNVAGQHLDGAAGFPQ